MANFKPFVTYMTSSSRHDYESGRLRCNSPYITRTFNTYVELKKKIQFILENHIGERKVTVSRSRRGTWGEWFEHWELVNGKPKIVKQGWQ